MNTTRAPHACRDMLEIRHEIDLIDQHIIRLLGERFRYVKAATPFKHSPDAVRDQARFDSMLQSRREWAAAQQLSPDVIEQLYRDLVTYFINEEMTAWQNATPGGATDTA